MTTEELMEAKTIDGDSLSILIGRSINPTGKTLVQKVYFYKCYGSINCDTNPLRPDDDWRIPLFETEIEVELPDLRPEKLVGLRVAQLENKRNKIMAEKERELQVVEKQIRELQALEYKPEPDQ